MKERRRYVRQSRSLEISYQILKKILRDSSRSINISETGICFPIVQRLQPGVVLDLEIRSVELERPIVAIGEVIWVNEKKGEKFPFEIGVRFIEIKTTDMELLSYLLKRLREKDLEFIRWIK